MHIGFDIASLATYGLPCACELTRYVHGVIPPIVLHIMWTRLSFSNISSNESLPRLCIDKEIDIVVNRFSEVDIVGKVTIKQKLLEITSLAMTSMVPPMEKFKTKGAQNKKNFINLNSLLSVIHPTLSMSTPSFPHRVVNT